MARNSSQGASCDNHLLDTKESFQQFCSSGTCLCKDVGVDSACAEATTTQLEIGRHFVVNFGDLKKVLEHFQGFFLNKFLSAITEISHHSVNKVQKEGRGSPLSARRVLLKIIYFFHCFETSEAFYTVSYTTFANQTMFSRKLRCFPVILTMWDQRTSCSSWWNLTPNMCTFDKYSLFCGQNGRRC